MLSRRCDCGILSQVLAGFLLFLGGGLIALGSRQDLLTGRPAGGESVTLNLSASHFGHAILVFSALIIGLGVARIARGFAKDAPLHTTASLISIAAVVAALARAAIFFSNHDLPLTSPSSYGHLGLAAGALLIAGGVVTTFLSKVA